MRQHVLRRTTHTDVQHDQGPFYALCGIIAGCPFATAYTRVCTIEALDNITLPATVQLALYIDDSGTSAAGKEHVVVDDIVTATTQIHEALVTDLGCNISKSKASVVSTSKAVVTALQHRLDNLAGAQQANDTAVNLGVDFTAGKPVRQQGIHTKHRKRQEKLARQTQRLHRMATTLGSRARRIFTTGHAPGAAYAAPVFGISDGELQHLRRSARAAMRPKAAMRSLAATLLLHGDPT